MLCDFPWMAWLELAIVGWRDQEASFSNLPVELCRPRTVEEKHYKTKGKWKVSFQSEKICQINFTKSDF